MNRPLISIIVPIYNVEKYLRKCINSILKQTYSNIEIILVDDGSRDSCPAICDEFALKDSRIRTIHKNNGGLSEARNVGLDVAKGEYIGFVDSDDYISQDMYEKLLSAMLKTKADMAVCNFTYVDAFYRFMENKNSLFPVSDEVLDADEYIKRLTGRGGWYFVTAWNKLYKRELFDDLRYPVGKQHEDEFLIHHLVFKCQKIVCIEQSLYFYVQRPDSIMGQKQKLKMMDYGDALIDRYHVAKFQQSEKLKYNTIKRLACKMEEWGKYSSEDILCKKKYAYLRKKALFLLYENSAWEGYNFRGRIFMRFKFLAPQLSESILNFLKDFRR